MITVVYRQARAYWNVILSCVRTSILLLSTFMSQRKSLPPLRTQIGLLNLGTAYKRALTISTTTNSQQSPRLFGGQKLTRWLQASTSNQEPIDITLGSQVLAVLLADRATVDDPRLLCDLVTDCLRQPLAESGVDLLRLRGGGDLSSANSPDRLVGNNNFSPLLSADSLSDGTELCGDDGDGLALLALLEGLAAAKDDADALVEGVLGLRGDKFVGLLEDDTALGVADQGPADVGVLELGGGDLAGEGALVLVEDVLGRNLDLLAELGACEKEVDGRGGDDDLCGVVLDTWMHYSITARKYTIHVREALREKEAWLVGMLLHSQTDQSRHFCEGQPHHIGQYCASEAVETDGSQACQEPPTASFG